MNVDEPILDDARRLEAADTLNLLPNTASAARQVRESWRLAQEAGVGSLAADGRPRAVVVVGVGASALAGDVLDAVAGQAAPVPVITHHRHGLPGWAGVADVILAVSVSGTSAETLSAVEEAHRRGCRLAVVGPADSPLSHLAELARAPFVALPEARPAYTGLWSLAVPLLAAAAALGVHREGEAAIEAAAVRLEAMASRCRPTSESFVNPAKTLALELAGALPLWWGTTRLTEVAATRAAGVLAVSAGYPALVGALPHPAEEQVALFRGAFGSGDGGAGSAGGDGDGDAADDDLADFFRDRVDDEAVVRLRLILLRDPAGEHPEIARAAERAVVLAGEHGVGVTELRAEGTAPLERLASLIGLIDFAGSYVGLALGVDPGAALRLRELGTPR
ncbi:MULTISPECIES: SIS domain-containing protein [unclassified Parafrankia]|uniref:SIS domain-containing protein n=1 Tax=unclassified Parafrankia TaxID=2994368 RepID=UPI000DA55D4B|nr:MULTISPECIES: SIS domain-containing protein [unclassified Parafrankia]TCJ34130.1 mannose-6-phosphate isomerase [Parafrankia sp. BMG5.11]SQD95493.1 Transcriptional regulator, RpiR family [Parafrankia sp. Ea1.12]